MGRDGRGPTPSSREGWLGLSPATRMPRSSSSPAHNIADNQGKCCDAVLRILERLHGATRQYIRRDQPSQGDVEVVCDIGRVRFALEHTRVDPYAGRVRDDIATSAFMQPVIDELTETLDVPSGSSFEIVIDVLALSRTKKHQIARMQEALILWVREHAGALPAPKRPAQLTWFRGRPFDIPFDVTLQRVGMRLSRRISYTRYALPALEQKRGLRIGDALRAKLPKLAVCRRAGMFSVLVLEDDDIALSNHSAIAVSLQEQLRSIAVEPPDAIYLVETMIDSWFVCTLKYENTIWPSAAPTVSNHVEFSATDLDDILAPTS